MAGAEGVRTRPITFDDRRRVLVAALNKRRIRITAGQAKAIRKGTHA